MELSDNLYEKIMEEKIKGDITEFNKIVIRIQMNLEILNDSTIWFNIIYFICYSSI